jgi:mono/diheme cytochrome c family protein
MKPDKIYLSLTLLILLTVFSWFTSCTHVANIANLPEVCFTGDIFPIIKTNCAISGCHDGGGESLPMNNYADIMQGITAGNAASSRIYQTIIAKWGNRMPPNKALSMGNRERIRIWIEQGAIESSAACPTATTGGNGGGTPSVARACFTRDILPVIVSRCATTGCHDAVTHKEGYNYTTYTNIRSSVSPGDPANSRLLNVIKLGSGESKMPPASSQQLSVAEIDSIGKWIGYGALNENCGEVCDTINPVTFSGTIWPIMQTYCTGCHTGTSPGGGIAIANYANVQTIAANGSLMNSLRGTGVSVMPKGSSFTVCRIRQFDIWVKNGALNN